MYIKRKGASGTVVTVIAISVVMMVAMFGYYLFVYAPARPASSVGTQTSIQSSNGQVNGVVPNVGMEYTASDSLAGGSASPSNAVYTWYHYQGNRLANIQSLVGVSGTALTTSYVTSQLTASDAQAGYILVSAYCGDNFYCDLYKLASVNVNPSIVGAKWIPVTNTGRPDLVLEVSLAALGTPNYATANNLLLNVGFPEFSETTLASVAVTDSYTSHKIISVGTTANTLTNLKFTINTISANKAAAVGKVLVFSNDSNTAPVQSLGNIVFGDTGPFYIASQCGAAQSLPAGQCGVQYSGISFSAPSSSSYQNGGSLTLPFANAQSLGYASATATYNYLFWPGSNQGNYNYLSNALILANPSNSFGDTTVSIQVTSSFTLATGGTAASTTGITLSIQCIAPTGALQAALTDKVTLSAGVYN